MKELKEKAEQIIKKNQKEFEHISDYIFKHPELGLKEIESSKFLVKELEKYGFDVEKKYCGIKTAFRGEIGSKTGPAIAFLAEYDALPGYGKNKNENGHACGHNWIAAATLGASITLAQMKDDIPGRIVIIGTPAEETRGSKVDMVKKGAFKDIDVVFQMHLGAETNIGCRALAIDSFMFEFYGKAAHAAGFPEEGINALDAVNLMYAGINCLRQHVKPDVRIHGVIRNGGQAPNIVPDFASCEFMIRSATREYLDIVTKKVINIANGAALMTGAKLKYHNVDNSFDNLLNLSTLQNLMKRNLTEAGVKNIYEGIDRGSGSSDIGNVSKVVPTMYSDMEIKTEKNCFVHNEAFLKYANSKQAYELITKAVRAMVGSSIELYTNKKLLKDVQKEFKEVTKTK